MNRVIRLLGLLGCVLLVACAGSAAVNYYRLESPAEAGAAVATRGAPQQQIGVWPLELPDELDRPEVVSYGAAGRVILAPDQRWAGSFRDSLQRRLVTVLNQRLAQGAWSYPWDERVRPAQQLRIRLEQLGGPLEGPVTLSASWILSGGDGRARAGRVRFSTPLPEREGAPYPRYIAALGASAERLAAQIAAEIAEP